MLSSIYTCRPTDQWLEIWSSTNSFQISCSNYVHPGISGLAPGNLGSSLMQRWSVVIGTGWLGFKDINGLHDL